MESQKFERNSKKKERVHIYRKKLHSLGQDRKQSEALETDSIQKLTNLSSKVVALQKTMNKTTDRNKLLQRYGGIILNTYLRYTLYCLTES